MDRFLRSKKERGALFIEADGCCESCGRVLAALEKPWHGGHTIPWRYVQRTNVHAMKALCADCNLKQGAHMIDITTHGREGQIRAWRVILQRVSAGEPFTAIVLPCSYGKRDVIWTSALELILTKRAACALVLNHNEALRDQMVSPDNINALARYKIPIHDVKYRNLIAKNYSPGVRFDGNGAMVISTTMQLVEKNLPLFHKWIRQRHYETGLPVLIYIDECQSESDSNSWGDAVHKLVHHEGMIDGAASAILMTATPFRSDGKPIPGFECENISEEEVLHILTSPSETPAMRTIKMYAAREYRWRLRAHHTTTTRQAWDEGVIATLSDFPYDVAGEQVTVDVDFGAQRLSELDAELLRSYLGRIIWDPFVIREGVRRFMESLIAYKHKAPECAGIIFCANDQRGDDEGNKHAKRIKDILHTYAPHWNIQIATSANGKQGLQTLNAFRRQDHPVGDVLIVKQMASVGLDSPRLKIGLDLSPLRADGTWFQRLMRISRLYHGLPGVWHHPDDILSRQLWTKHIETQGGSEGHYRTIEELLEEYETPIQARASRTFRVDGVENADFFDSQATAAQAGRQPVVRAILGKFPQMAHTATYPEISQFFEGWTPKEAAIYEAPPPIDQQLEDRYTQCNDLAHSVTRMRVARTGLAYEVCIEEVWREAKTVKLRAIQDLDALQALVTTLSRMEAMERDLR